MRTLADHSIVYVTEMRDPDCLEVHISPNVATYEHHAQRRVAASVMFEIAAKMAEKGNCTILHLANVAGCKDDTEPLLADYPLLPFQWERLCRGFKETFLLTP